METVDFFKEKNVNTTKAMNTWYHRYCTWAIEKGHTHKLEDLDASSVNEILERFFTKVKKVNGDNYEPTTLGGIQASLHRYLKEKGSTLSIFKDGELQGSRDVKVTLQFPINATNQPKKNAGKEYVSWKARPKVPKKVNKLL